MTKMEKSTSRLRLPITRRVTTVKKRMAAMLTALTATSMVVKPQQWLSSVRRTFRGSLRRLSQPPMDTTGRGSASRTDNEPANEKRKAPVESSSNQVPDYWTRVNTGKKWHVCHLVVI